MHTCLEAKCYDGKIWTCKTDEFTAYNGASVVFLEGFVGYFSTKYLRRVEILETI
ncbi:hypothetical protein [Bacillus sp. S14(2024)]|uniref:hypothetical protein n=1 Tax=Bacillus sp. S14(2024) TaxID=3162884 RepID=UPI003D1B2E4E